MAGVPVPAYQHFGWTSGSRLVSKNPDAAASIKQFFKVLCDLEDLASYTPLSVGQSEEWASLTSSAEENRKNFCKALRGKSLFSALYGTYTVTMNELKSVLKASRQQGDGFKEVRNRKRHSMPRGKKYAEEGYIASTIYKGGN
jgi:hypothetical protein